MPHKSRPCVLTYPGTHGPSNVNIGSDVTLQKSSSTHLPLSFILCFFWFQQIPKYLTSIGADTDPNTQAASSTTWRVMFRCFTISFLTIQKLSITELNLGFFYGGNKTHCDNTNSVHFTLTSTRDIPFLWIPSISLLSALFVVHFTAYMLIYIAKFGDPNLTVITVKNHCDTDMRVLSTF